jgi:2'-5' RNA ligase
MHRLFVALRPPRAIRDTLIAIGEGIDGADWVDEDDLHLTLRYIGKVERPVAEDVAIALQSVRAPAPTVTLAGIGTFDGRQRARAVWAGVAPHDALTALHHKVDRALVAIGLPPEGRAYLPHITLARLRGSAGPVDAFAAVHAGLTSPPITLDHFILYESHIGPGGAWYEPVARYPLQ